MKKAKTIGIGIVAVFCVVCIVCLCVTYLGNGNWPKRFGTELNHFFGPENWELLSSESKESLMYTTTTRDTTGISQEVPGTYKNWQILYTDPSGKETVYQITNHTLKINHDKHWSAEFQPVLQPSGADPGAHGYCIFHCRRQSS